MVPLSLDPVCPCHLWILTALLVDSTEARDLTHSSLLTMFFCFGCHRLHKELLSTPCTTKLEKKYFPVLLRTTKLARTTSQYYFVHLCTTKLAQSTSQYYFVLQSLHKRSPELLRTARLAQNTFQYYFVYYKAYTIYFPVLLCFTRLAQSTSQYYFYHLLSTSYYKTCTK